MFINTHLNYAMSIEKKSIALPRNRIHLLQVTLSCYYFLACALCQEIEPQLRRGSLHEYLHKTMLVIIKKKQFTA